MRTVKNFYTVFQNFGTCPLDIFTSRRKLEQKTQSVKSSGANSKDLQKRGCESSLAQYWTERTSSRVDVRSWPGSRRLAAARKLASSNQSAWLGASSLLRGLETPKRTPPHHPTLRERGFLLATRVAEENAVRYLAACGALKLRRMHSISVVCVKLMPDVQRNFFETNVISRKQISILHTYNFYIYSLSRWSTNKHQGWKRVKVLKW